METAFKAGYAPAVAGTAEARPDARGGHRELPQQERPARGADRAPDCLNQRRTVAWVLGWHDDATCRRFLAKVGVKGKTFVTDDWEGYHRVIPDA